MVMMMSRTYRWHCLSRSFPSPACRLRSLSQPVDILVTSEMGFGIDCTNSACLYPGQVGFRSLLRSGKTENLLLGPILKASVREHVCSLSFHFFLFLYSFPFRTRPGW